MKIYIVNGSGEAFTSRSSYDRPKFVKVSRGTSYVTEGEAMRALNNLMKYGNVGLSIKKVEASDVLKEFKLSKGEDGAVTDKDVPTSTGDDMTAVDSSDENDENSEDDSDEENEEQSISPRELAMSKQLGVTYGKRGEKMFKGKEAVKEEADTKQPVENNYASVKDMPAVSKGNKVKAVPELMTDINAAIKELEDRVDAHGDSLETAEGNTNLTALTVAKKIKDLLGSKEQSDFILLQVLVNGLGSPIADKMPESVRFYAQSGGRSFKKDIVRPAPTPKKDPVNESVEATALNEFVQKSYRIRLRGTIDGSGVIGTIGRGSVKIGGKSVECDSFDVSENTRTVTILCRLISRMESVSREDIERAGVTVNGSTLTSTNATVSEGREV